MKNKFKYKVSVVVPCYKVEEYLRRCLDSLVNQTLKNIEIICINDGSPDNSLEILKEYQEKYKESFKVIDKKNEGVWKARFSGIDVAQGEYLAIVDSDDYVDLDYLNKLYSSAKKNKSDIVVCGFYRMDDKTRTFIFKRNELF